MKNRNLYVIACALFVLCLVVYYYSATLFSKEGSYTRATSTNANVGTTSQNIIAKTYPYIEVTTGCNPYYVGECVNVRSGPGKEYPVVARLRTGIVLRVEEATDTPWHKIIFTTELLYPDRVKDDWYVSTDVVRLFYDDGDHNVVRGIVSTSTKRIVIDISKEKLYAYDGEVLLMEESISTGLEFTPTPRGTFPVFRMTPSRFMQGPIPNVSDQKYDLPGVPWNLYFTADGAVIHGAYWHDHFGEPWSHGCVNLSPPHAKKLYEWAEMGVMVTVQN